MFKNFHVSIIGEELIIDYKYASGKAITGVNNRNDFLRNNRHVLPFTPLL